MEHDRDEAESLNKFIALGPHPLTMISKIGGAYTFGETVEALAAIPFHELGSHKAVSALLGMQTRIKMLIVELADTGIGVLEFQAKGGGKLGGACGLVQYHAGLYLKTLPSE